jgi:uncharacterized membrane-anchored protein
MRLSSIRRSRPRTQPGVTGTARLDRRTWSAVKRVRPGDIAVIDHVDIDRGAAEALVAAGVAAVVNLAPSVSGRYPCLGPGVLVDAGVILVDSVGADAFTAVNDGDLVRIDGDCVYRGDDLVATGARQTPETVAAALEASKDGLASQLEAFSANAIEHLRREQGTLLDGRGVPDVRTAFARRQVLVVSRAYEFRRDLASLKTYIRENSPVLIGVEAGADALLEAGYRPSVIVGDMSEVSEAALRSGAEIVVRAGADGRVAASHDRLERLAVTHKTFATGGTSEDAAIILAHTHGAELIVTAGSHASLIEFMDRGRSGMASSFLTRAAVGPTVVDAKAVAALYRNRVRTWLVLLLVVVAIAMVSAAVFATPVGQDWWQQLRDWADNVYDDVRGQLT